ncbi:MAG: glycosyltransferase family 39 protein, partial [Planctomycetia bacterium]
AVFAALTLVVLAEAGRRRLGPLVGGAAAMLLAVNFAFLYAGSLVACETLLVLLVFAAWLAATTRRPWSAEGAVALGLLFGAAYLTKASAFFLFVATLGLLGIDPGRGSWRRRVALVGWAAVGFTLIAAPLLARNARVYGNPLYSFNNKLLFADTYEEGIGRPDLGLSGNWQRYRADHSWSDMVKRAAAGGVVESFILLRTLGPAPLESGRAAIGLVLLAAAVAAWAADARRSPPRELNPWLTPLWVMVFWVFFAWYTPIAAGDRFLLPLLPPLLLAAADGLVRTAVVAAGGRRAPGVVVGVSLGLAAAVLSGTLLWWNDWEAYFPR